MAEILTETEQTETTQWHSQENADIVQRCGWKTGDDAIQSYRNLEKMDSGKVKMPTTDSSTEEISTFYKQCGRPDAADGYTKPTLAEGVELDGEFFGKMATIAHGKGCSDALFTDLTSGFIEYAAHLEAQNAEAEVVEFNRYREEADRKLHDNYGADYDKNIELSKRAYTEYASDELKELLGTDKYKSLMNEPAFIGMMVEIGKKNMDDTFVRGDGQPEKPKDNYVPNSPNSPTMYATMDGEEGIKARAYFRAKGHVYERKD